MFEQLMDFRGRAVPSAVLLLVGLLSGCAGAGPYVPPAGGGLRDVSLHAPRLKGVRKEIGASPRRGSGRAPVTIVVFSDFQCRHCRRAAGVLDEVLKRYPRRVLLVFKNLPLSFHHQAEAAALAALAAGEQGRFWSMHDRLFEEQSRLGGELYQSLAAELGLDRRRFDRDRASGRLTRLLRLDRSLAARWAVRATPRVIVNGRIAGPVRSLSDLQPLIEAELESAERRKRKPGTDPRTH